MRFSNKIAEWRQRRRLTQDALADRAGLSKGFISLLEAGKKQYTQETIEKIARVLDTEPANIVGIGPNDQQAIPIVGKVFAGPDGSYIDDYIHGAHPTVEPFETEGRVAAIVEGDSMLPRFRPGETLIFGPERTNLASLINEEILAAPETGPWLIKVLRPSSEKGRWDLYSINTTYKVMEGISLLWARPFEGLKV